MAATPFPNQPPPYEGRNLLRADAVLVDAVKQLGLPASRLAELEHWGGVLGTAATFADAAAANRALPRLVTHDRRRNPRARSPITCTRRWRTGRSARSR